MTSIDKIGIFIARVVTVALWALTLNAINHGAYAGAVVVGLLSWGAYKETKWDWL